MKIQQIVGKAQTGNHGVGFEVRRTFGDTNVEQRHQLVLFLKRDAEEKRLRICEKYKMQAG